MGIGINQGKWFVLLCLAIWMHFAIPISFAQRLTISSEEIPPDRVEVTVAQLQNDNHLFWPMMPGDTLKQLAVKLYPNSPILQQRFILKAQALSKIINLNITGATQFQSPQFIIIPSEKSVRELTHRIKRVEDTYGQEEKLKLSYGLDFSLPKYPTVEPQNAQFKLSLPNLKMPSVRLPAITFPKLEHSAFNLTPLKDKVVGHWHNFSHKSLLVTKKLSQDTLTLIHGYQGKNFIQILNNYRLRNVALISILILVFIFLWVAHRRHQKKHRVMLSDIERTVKNHDTLPDMVAPLVAASFTTVDHEICTSNNKDEALDTTDIVLKSEIETSKPASEAEDTLSVDVNALVDAHIAREASG